MRKCGTEINDVESYKVKKAFNMRENRVNDDLYLGVHYFVLYRSSQEDLSLNQIQAQHNQLNLSYNKMNFNVDQVPNSGRYQFTAADAKIHFLPSVLSSSEITRIPISNEISSLTQAKLFINPIDGILNVIIAPLSGGLLGQAELDNNYCVVETKTIGSNEVPGTQSNYDLGYSLVHEVGHCLSLVHPFLNGTDCVQPYADIPSQKNPNYFAILNPPSLDNRNRDCLYYLQGNTSVSVPNESFPLSCFNCPSCSTQCASDSYEFFMNFMDYNVDQYMACFSQDEVDSMHDFLLSAQTAFLLLGPDSTMLPTLTNQNSVTDDAMPYWAWILIGVGIFLVILGIGLSAFFLRPK